MIYSQPSVIISSGDPEKLIGFYSSLTKASISEGITKKDYSLKSLETFEMNFYKPTSKQNATCMVPPSIALCFRCNPSTEPLSSIKRLLDDAISLGAKLIEGPRLEPFGAEAWLYDIEDNKFLILVPFE